MDLTDFLIKATITVAIGAFFIVLNEIVFRRLYREHEKTHLLFLQRFIRVFILAIVIMGIIAEYWGLTRLANLITGSVVIISGIIGFAAQSILKDFFAGLMISIYRPYDVGDRLLLSMVEKPCVVEELTMRHTVLKTMDGIRYVIPNSEMGSSVITNTSYRQRLRGSFIKIPISYDSDIEKAVHIMRDAVKNCPRTLPNNHGNADLDGYGDVYLMGFESSSLTLETVIWTEPETDNFLACSEVRAAIIHAFREHGIEIPYSYLNLIEKDEAELKQAVKAVRKSEYKGKKRNTKIKTDPVMIRDAESGLHEVMEKVEKYATYYSMPEKNKNTLRLLSEELLSFSADITGTSGGKYYLSGNRDKVHICFKTKTNLDAEKRQELLTLSSTGKNEAASGFSNMIRSMIASLGDSGEKKTVSLAGYKEQVDANADDLEKQILTSISDDIKVAIRSDVVEITILKSFL